MNACYLYAIVGVPEDGPALLAEIGPALGDMPLQLVVHEGLGAVVSAWPWSRHGGVPTAGEAEVWQHERIVEALMYRMPTLPVRFGTILGDSQRVRQLLAERRADFSADLAHVAGRVEMGLRVLWEPPEPPMAPTATAPPVTSTAPGIRYLQRRVAQQRHEQAVRAQAEALVQELNAALYPLSVDARRQVLLTERLVLSATYLVEQAAVVAFQAGVEQLRQSHTHLAFLASGPWPAYHFVSDARTHDTTVDRIRQG